MADAVDRRGLSQRRLPRAPGPCPDGPYRHTLKAGRGDSRARSGLDGRAQEQEPDIRQCQRDPSTVTAPTGDISTSADVAALLAAFYGAALLDQLLGPVFRTAGVRLETHLPRIAAFWEVTLLGTGTYTGSPLALHRRAAAASGMGKAHFARWLLLWERTVTSMFTGPTATRAVTEAERMAAGMLRDLHRHSVEHEGAVRVPSALRIVAPARTASS